MASEQLNSALAISFIAAVVLFLLAWAVLLTGAGAFVILSLRYRRFRWFSYVTADERKTAEHTLQSGRLGLYLCAATLVFYFLRQWVGSAYADDIARGLAAYSPIWWKVFPLTLLWWATVPLGIVGTILTSRSGLQLYRLMQHGAAIATAPATEKARSRAGGVVSRAGGPTPASAVRVLALRLPAPGAARARSNNRQGETAMKMTIGRILVGVGVVVLQLVAANVVTLGVSMALPAMTPSSNRGAFVVLAGIAFSIGIIAAGALSLGLGWLKSPHAYHQRAALTVVGVYLPLVAALLLGQLREGSKFFVASMLVGILGFHVGGWLKRS